MIAESAPPIRKLDEIDQRLLSELRRNGRTSQEHLSQVLSLSRPAVRDRMRRLESLGIISGYTIVVDWEALGYPILAFIWVRTANGNCETHARDVMRLSNDTATIEVVTALQRHFRPEKVDGITDHSTLVTLQALLASLPAEATAAATAS